MPPEQAHEILRILHIQERKPNKEESKLALIKEEEVEDILAPNINKPTAECKVEEKSGSESEPKVVLMPQSTWQVHYHP